MSTHFYGDGCPQHNGCQGFEMKPNTWYHAHDVPKCLEDGVRMVDGEWLCDKHASGRETAAWKEAHG